LPGDFVTVPYQNLVPPMDAKPFIAHMAQFSSLPSTNMIAQAISGAARIFITSFSSFQNQSGRARPLLP
jgi:flagellar hook assembly protein FlgD